MGRGLVAAGYKRKVEEATGLVVVADCGWNGTRSAAVECPAVVSLTRGPHTCRPTCQWPNCRLPNCSGSLSGGVAHDSK